LIVKVKSLIIETDYKFFLYIKKNVQIAKLLYKQLNIYMSDFVSKFKLNLGVSLVFSYKFLKKIKEPVLL